MAVYPFQFVNRRGSAAISTSGVTVNTDNVVFSFPNHAFVNAWYRGTIYIDLAQAVPTGTTGTLPVLFETNGVTQAVTKYNGEALTACAKAGYWPISRLRASWTRHRTVPSGIGW